MFQIGKTIVSEDVLEKEFVCNLSACKGQCCIDGDAGAPVEEGEVEIMKQVYEHVKPYLRPEGVAAIEAQGTSIIGEDGEYETPLIQGGECAYVIYENDALLCGIEKAYIDGKIDWKKPISCHLYPIRIKEFSSFEAVNYHRWHICSDACTLGQELNVPVYKFLKDPLIRKYGTDWYTELEQVAAEWAKQKR
ncbi:MAG: DUF3109 family protein [Flavobacteriaceae bacterium]|jgi:hypothetical protein|nr:DUF3109 family protein [Flavobacteriaceae bacterium]